MFYKTWSVTCPDACEWSGFVCDNWNWHNEWYPAQSCTPKDGTCEWYNITEEYYNSYIPKLKKSHTTFGTEYNWNNDDSITGATFIIIQE